MEDCGRASGNFDSCKFHCRYLKELVHSKINPTYFGRYFSITDSKGKKPTIHVPMPMFMLPKPVADRIMQEIPGKAVLIQFSGLGVSRFF